MHAARGEIGGVEKAEERQQGAAANAWWVTGGLIVIGAVLFVATPLDTAVTPLFTAAPLVAASLLTMRDTVIAAALAVGTLILLLALFNTSPFDEQLTELSTMATIALLAPGISYIVTRGGQRLASARAVAEIVQRAVVPAPIPRMGELRIAARYRTAELEARIGGDLYAAQRTPYGVRLLIGDIRGKGMGAAETVAEVLGAFREAAEYEPELTIVCSRMDAALARNNTRQSDLVQAENFITALLLEIPSGAPDQLQILNRGHPPPLLLYRGTVRALQPTVPALPLGLSDLGGDIEQMHWETFPAGAALLLHTDGVSEARNARGVFYDPAKGLSGRTFSGPDALLDWLLDDVAAYTGNGPEDDVALLAVQREEPGVGGDARTPGHRDH